jgi:hypothetical protein
VMGSCALLNFKFLILTICSSFIRHRKLNYNPGLIPAPK